MKNVSVFLSRYFELLLLILIFFLVQQPLRDFDIWFHMKAGEYFVLHGLQFSDPFSHASNGRTWIAFEWLFQILSYELSRIGLWILPPFIALFVTSQAYIFLVTQKKVFGTPLIVRVITLLIFLIGGLEFMTARPHMLAYTFLFLELSLILMRIEKRKKWYFILPLLTLFWTNIHSTGFLSWGMLTAYASIAAFQYIITRQKSYLQLAREFGIVGLICAAVTILPPKGFRDYQLLYEFFVNRQFLAVFIAEWAPPFAEFMNGFLIYTTIFGIALIGIAWMLIKERKWIEHLWIVPFLIIGAVGFSATRNVYLGYYAGTFLLAWVTPKLISYTPYYLRKIVWGTLCVVLIGILGTFFVLKRQSITGDRRYFPVQSTIFANKYLKGKMFNEYSYGGYMLYNSFPKLRVFIDGRAEVYLCCEMKDYLALSINKNMPDEEYRKFLNLLWNEYGIDFAIIGVQKHVVMRKIGNILQTDPDWALVFWDDDSEVFVRKNGKNDEIIKQLEAKAATPYARDPFNKDKIDKALYEYERIDEIVKSARTSNALGYIYALQGNMEKARERFNDAVDRDPSFESPYMNLAELSLQQNELTTAVGLYKKALARANDRGLIYLRLAKLLLMQSPGKKDEVRRLVETGIEKTVDADAKKQLKTFLSEL